MRTNTATPGSSDAARLFHGAADEAFALAGLAEEVGQEVDAVNAHERRLVALDAALHERDVLGAVERVAEDDDAELAAPGAFEIAFDAALEEAVMAAAPGDEVGDGADLQAVQLGERDQLRQARHACHRRS